LWFGRHPDHVRHLIAVTVSEGIGVGLLLNGQLVHGGHAMAGEFGHVTIDENGPPCPCGKRGCWERYASNSAALRYYTGDEPRRDEPSRSGTPGFGDVLRAAANGERRAIEAIERMAHFLGIGLAGLATGLAPDMIVIIGEVTGAWDLVGPIVRDTVTRQSLPHVTTRIVPTDPAMQPRLRGAVTLVVQQHFSAPHVA
jgi:predicted NBD/HSP70 family sugar kinase